MNTILTLNQIYDMMYELPFFRISTDTNDAIITIAKTGSYSDFELIFDYLPKGGNESECKYFDNARSFMRYARNRLTDKPYSYRIQYMRYKCFLFPDKVSEHVIDVINWLLSDRRADGDAIEYLGDKNGHHVVSVNKEKLVVCFSDAYNEQHKIEISKNWDKLYDWVLSICDGDNKWSYIT